MLKATSPVEAIRLNLSILRLPLAIVLSGVVLAIVQYALLAEHIAQSPTPHHSARLPEASARLIGLDGLLLQGTLL